jgi:glutamate-5-semialdehyde dehydrogenase
MVDVFVKNGVEVRGDKDAIKAAGNNAKITEADETDWNTEYNDLIISVKVIGTIDDAIEFINKHGSKHTDSIVTENKYNAMRFISLVDSSSVLVNASTRFSDGFRYGKGAEVGISTNKVHSRGPVGMEGLLIYKYILVGNGHVVKDYAGKDAKKFKHISSKKQFRL